VTEEGFVVTSKQRQRQLARAKWQRQQSRRQEHHHRQRVISIVVGIIVGLIVVALLVWLVLHIIDQENQDQTPSVPTDSFSTNLLTPSAAPTSPGESNGTDQPTSPDTSRGDGKATKSGGKG
jgi:peptidyl-prolyl cis-trans isomerase B (cyclophilin B)